MKRKLKFLIFVLGLFFVMPNVYAASLNVSASAYTVNPGAKIKITANANGLTGKFSISNSNPNVLSGSTGNDWLENSSGKYEFTAKSLGTATITISAVDVSDSSNGSTWTGSKTVTINVVKPREKSNNNNLKDLSVEGYEISPSFSKDTLEYTVNIDKNIEKIKINTKLEDGYAKVSGNGEIEVEEGSNKLEVVVTSETGSSKTYVLNVNVKDTNPITKIIDGKEYNVIKRAKSLILPDVLNKDDFTLSSVKMDDTDIPIYTSENLTLIGLKDDKGNSYLFKYENNEIKEKYEIFSSDKINILFTQPEDIKDGYSKTDITINGKDYTGYKIDDTILIYGTNMDTNVSNWYRYDSKENTIQIYDSSVLDKLNTKEKEFNNTLDEYKIIILGLVALSVVLIIIVVALLISKSKLKNRVNKANIEPKKEIKKEEKVVVKEEPIKKEKNNKKEEIATKIEETENKDKQDEKEIDKVEEELKQEEKQEEVIPSVEEIEEDLKDIKKEKVNEESKEDDELMDPYDFLDIKKKKRKK